MSKRIRECGPIHQTGIGKAIVRRNADWTRVDITDGTWTLNDPDSTLSSISNTGGLNQVVIGTQNNEKIVDGGVHWKEVLNADGTSIDFTDRPVSVDFMISWPNSGWYVRENTPSGWVEYASGGNNRPAVGSRCYTVAGVMTDPENLPSSAGESEWPRDILGCGLSTKTNVTKHRMFGIKNSGTGSPRGTLSFLNADLNAPHAVDDYDNEGRKFMNRLSWRTHIIKREDASTTGIHAGDEPMADEMSYEKYWDRGETKVAPLELIVTQHFGRVRTDRLYVWISSGRSQGGAGSSVTVDFNVYYKIYALDGGTHPSGRTGL